MINATLEARLGSKRFPNKLFRNLGKTTFLQFQVKRILKSKHLKKLIIATTKKKQDKKILNLSKKLKIDCYSGESENVLKRIYNIHKKNKSKVLVRLCGDNPFQDPKMIDDAIKIYLKGKYDIVCYGGPPGIRKIPYGFDIEVLSFDLLALAFKKARKKIHLEHPTKYLYDKEKNLEINYLKPKNKKFFEPKMTFALDYPDQEKFLNSVLLAVKDKNASYKKIITTVKRTKKLNHMAKILTKKYVLKRKF